MVVSKSRINIETASNLAIITIALLLGGVLINHFLTDSQEVTPKSQPTIKPGTQLPLSRIDWSRNERTLLLLLSTTCKYCSDSAEFYKRLTEKTSDLSKLQTIAVFPQKVGEAAAFLKGRSVQVGTILEAEPRELSVRGTPTLLLVNKKGVVLDSWVGKLSAEREQEVMVRILEDVVNKDG